MTGEELVSSLAHPVVTCGPRASYEWVATRPLCPGGTNPFKGDIEQARQARVGSKRVQPNGHPIDLYEIPCGTQKRTIYVDLYGCPEYENRLRQYQQPSSELQALTENFDAGAFQKVLDRCQVATNHAADEDTYCLWLVPAALEVLGRSEDSWVRVQNVCRGMPAASRQSDARAQYVAMVLIALSESARKGNYAPTEDHRKSLPESLGAGCGISNAEIGRAMNKLAGPD
jgi:hypothetical protein